MGVTCSLGSVGNTGLSEDVAHVSGYRIQADQQLVSDLLVGLAGHDEA